MEEVKQEPVYALADAEQGVEETTREGEEKRKHDRDERQGVRGAQRKRRREVPEAGSEQETPMADDLRALVCFRETPEIDDAAAYVKMMQKCLRNQVPVQASNGLVLEWLESHGNHGFSCWFCYTQPSPLHKTPFGQIHITREFKLVNDAWVAPMQGNIPDSKVTVTEIETAYKHAIGAHNLIDSEVKVKAE